MLHPETPGRPGIALVSISRLRTLCETVTPRYARSGRFISVTDGYGAAVTRVRALIETGDVDVVLAAGSNGAYLREHLPVPVVTVRVNGFDVLKAIGEAAAARPGAPIGLILHESVSEELAGLGRWLQVTLLQRAYRSIDEVTRAVDHLVGQGCEVVIGPGMACDLAQAAGVDSVFLYSVGAVEEAFERALELGTVRRQQEAKRQRLDRIVAHLREGFVAFDRDRRVEAVNPAMLDLLGLSAGPAADARLAADFDEMVDEVARQGVAIEERVARHGARSLIISCLPIVEHGAFAGAVLTAQDGSVVQRIDRTLRSAQRTRHSGAGYRLGDLVGASPELVSARALAALAAAREVTVLLEGESGTGKELVAQGIHRASARRNQAFVAFNCAALPEGLIEAELFGHEEGAFTGARRGGKPGLFEMADRGTIFLDEIGEMPLALQSRLLRVLQEREVTRLGATRATPVDVRVIAATHRDLYALVGAEQFRADLYFRLNLLPIRLPALRERRADIGALARHLLARGDPALPERDVQRVLAFVAPLLDAYDWPGNVRELDNFLQRAVIHLLGGLDSGIDGNDDDDGNDGDDAAVRGRRPAHAVADLRLDRVFPEFARFRHASARAGGHASLPAANRDAARSCRPADAAGPAAAEPADPAVTWRAQQQTDPSARAAHRAGASHPLPRAMPDQQTVREALRRHGGNRAAASRALGIGRTTLWRLLRERG